MKLFSNLDNLRTLSPQIIPPIHPSAAFQDGVGLPVFFANFLDSPSSSINLHKKGLLPV